MTNTNNNTYICPAELAIHNMSGKWTIRIMQELMESPKRPCQLYKALPGISSKVLNQRLKHLKEIGVVNQYSRNEKTLHTEYHLTELGQFFRKVMIELDDFGKKLEQKSF